MKLHECIEEFEKNPGKYKGWSSPDYFDMYGNQAIYFIRNQTIFFNYIGGIDKVNNEKHDVNISSSVFLTQDNWFMVEKFIVPDGYKQDYRGVYYKSCSFDIWVVVYLYKDLADMKNKIGYCYFSTAKEAEKYVKGNFCLNSSSVKYIKTLHLKQQYSIPYDKNWSIKD